MALFGQNFRPITRLLQEGTYYPLGSDRPKQSRARVLVATHCDVRRDVDGGRFRLTGFNHNLSMGSQFRGSKRSKKAFGIGWPISASGRGCARGRAFPEIWIRSFPAGILGNSFQPFRVPSDRIGANRVAQKAPR